MSFHDNREKNRRFISGKGSFAMKLKFGLSCLFSTAALMFLTGCGDSPKDVANKWRQAILEGDIKTANELSIEEAHAVNGIVINELTDDPDQPELVNLVKFDYDEEKINGNKAVVFNKVNPQEKLKMIKSNGKWFVTHGKNN